MVQAHEGTLPRSRVAESGGDPRDRPGWGRRQLVGAANATSVAEQRLHAHRRGDAAVASAESVVVGEEQRPDPLIIWSFPLLRSARAPSVGAVSAGPAPPRARYKRRHRPKPLSSTWHAQSEQRQGTRCAKRWREVADAPTLLVPATTGWIPASRKASSRSTRSGRPAAVASARSVGQRRSIDQDVSLGNAGPTPAGMAHRRCSWQASGVGRRNGRRRQSDEPVVTP